MTISKPTDYNKGLPGIPLASLDAIKDENTRNVLRAIADGWNVRNGSSGDGTSRFVTAAELSTVRNVVANAETRLRSLESAPAGDNYLTSGGIARVINDLQASVMESQLWKELGERIKLIEINASQNATGLATEITNRINADNAIVQTTTTQFAVINGNVGALQTQQTTTANNVAALSSSITTLQAQVGNNSSAIQIEAQVRASADNDIYGKYSVKIDQNGYVAGYGLISTANTGTPISEFVVRADRFAIGSPSGPSVTPTVPFVVQTTPKTQPDGSVLAPGVYIGSAMVKELFGAYISAGLLDAAKIYTGSRVFDRDSKFEISAVAAGSWNPGTVTWSSEPMTSSGLRLFGSNLHSWTGDVYKRVRNSNDGRLIAITIQANATVDHFLSVWYRFNGGSWVPMQQVVEPQGGYGSASIGVVILAGIGSNDYVDIGVAPTNTSGTPYSINNLDMRDLSVFWTAVNL